MRTSLRASPSTLRRPSLLRDSVRSDVPYFGPLGSVVGDPLAVAGLGDPLLVVPIVVGGRVIAAVICDRVRALPSPLVRVCAHESALAYERVLRERRNR